MYEIHEFTLFSDFKNCLKKMNRIPEVSVKAVMEQEEKIKEQEEKIKDLEAQLAALKQ